MPRAPRWLSAWLQWCWFSWGRGSVKHDHFFQFPITPTSYIWLSGWIKNRINMHEVEIGSSLPKLYWSGSSSRLDAQENAASENWPRWLPPSAPRAWQTPGKQEMVAEWAQVRIPIPPVACSCEAQGIPHDVCHSRSGPLHTAAPPPHKPQRLSQRLKKQVTQIEGGF